MAHIGLTTDELLSLTWSARPQLRYAARVDGLNILAAETVALVGDGSPRLLDRLAELLEGCAVIDGAAAAAAGTLRIHAQQAARVGVQALAISEPFPAGLPGPARSLALADLAGLSQLGVTSVVEVGDVMLATLLADRVVVVRGGRPVVAYPVIATTPRSPDDVGPVAARVASRLAA